MPFLPPNQQCQSTEGRKEPLGSKWQKFKQARCPYCHPKIFQKTKYLFATDVLQEQGIAPGAARRHASADSSSIQKLWQI